MPDLGLQLTAGGKRGSITPVPAPDCCVVVLSQRVSSVAHNYRCNASQVGCILLNEVVACKMSGHDRKLNLSLSMLVACQCSIAS